VRAVRGAITVDRGDELLNDERIVEVEPVSVQ
jgi:hypothetical protein